MSRAQKRKHYVTAKMLKTRRIMRATFVKVNKYYDKQYRKFMRGEITENPRIRLSGPSYRIELFRFIESPPLICHSSNEDIPQLMKDEVARRIAEHPPMLISGEIGAIETIEFIRYGERITADNEADPYERITGRRSSVFG